MSAVKLTGRVGIVLMCAAAIAYGAMLVRHLSWAAGGADSSGYLNEARMMAAGRTSLPIPLLETLHLSSEWADVFTPLGFAPSHREPRTMVPTYPPGLPAHFALAATLGRWARAPFLIPPLAALICLALMIVLARQLGLSLPDAFASAVFLAVCPVFLFMAAQPMSDVVATVWTLAAMVCAIASADQHVIPRAGGTMPQPRTAHPHRFLPFVSLRVGMTYGAPLAAGAAFAISVCVRPSNILIAIPLAFAMRWRMRPLMLAVAGALPFAIALMIWNHALYGSAAATGYGSVREMLSWDFPRERFPHYSYWLAAQLTPLIFPGGLLVAFDRRAPRRAMLVSWFAVLFVFYCFYTAYDAWWYTRFLLPAIPPLIIGFFLLMRDLRAPRGVVAILVMVVLGVALWQDRRFTPLNVGQDESIYPETVHWAEQQLPRDAIVMTGMFSGSFLYYSGRPTIRNDFLDNDQFQQLRAYVGAAGLHWYALLPPWELEVVEKRLKAKWTVLGEHRGMKLLRLD